MNGKERLLAAFRGEVPDQVPFAPNLYLWFYYHLYHGTLPEPVREARHPFDVLRYLGADILARWDTQWATREVYTAGQYLEEYSGESDWAETCVTAFNLYPPRRTERRQRFVTPYGTLTQGWSFTREAGTDFESEYWWKDWEEYRAVRYMLESREYEFDSALFHEWVDRVGTDGLVMLNLTCSPLKELHWLAGPQNASLLILEHPDEMKELAEIHEAKVLTLLEKVADTPGAEVFISQDNLDSAFYPPQFYRDYCSSFFRRAAEILHRRGKFLMVHACGRSRVLLPRVGADGVDCLEGVTPPPMGDVQLGAVRGLTGYDGFTVNGGMDSVRQEIGRDAGPTLHAYVRDLFAAMGDKRHFIFASSCMTSPLTPWENLVHFRDAALEYGQVS